ncbi:MAG: hypothetical protein QOJ80_2860 [Mycobacterium sp.]|nr:hypothetical protein [Mycobacterium sp.]
MPIEVTDGTPVGRVRWIALASAAVIGGIAFASTCLTPPAAALADPADDPCSLAVSFLCHFMPMAPNLDGDVDLTKQQPPADPADPRATAPPLTDICISGCI